MDEWCYLYFDITPKNFVCIHVIRNYLMDFFRIRRITYKFNVKP